MVISYLIFCPIFIILGSSRIGFKIANALLKSICFISSAIINPSLDLCARGT